MINKSVAGNPLISTDNPGSTVAQICFLTDRVAQLSIHLKSHNKDYSSQRGLRKLLGRRKRLLTYLYRRNPMQYEQILNQLGIRGLKKNIKRT
uniref:Small ribosomal subunit protein uS15c n=2 Tax=Roya TaxID=43942 RepID=A0A024B3L6_9VIRI|nr:ribosomal protein S15 [Roya anglica]YP_009256932.1 ribosomal protein S15 [Roya obtusa]AHZ11154.1 ribosomal protein S15 [Roya anglica]ANI25980.1 ribosomal protein S15 [Roya obtusa]